MSHKTEEAIHMLREVHLSYLKKKHGPEVKKIAEDVEHLVGQLVDELRRLEKKGG